MPPKSARPTVFNLKVLYSVALLLCGFGTATAQNTRCTFNLATLSYEGTAVEQAKCLLRPVKIFANLGPRTDTLPDCAAAMLVDEDVPESDPPPHADTPAVRPDTRMVCTARFTLLSCISISPAFAVCG